MTGDVDGRGDAGGYGEPWKLLGIQPEPRIHTNDGTPIADWCVGHASCEEMGDFINPEKAARIVACVNACRGLSNDQLAAVADGKAILLPALIPTPDSPHYHAATLKWENPARRKSVEPKADVENKFGLPPGSLDTTDTTSPVCMTCHKTITQKEVLDHELRCHLVAKNIHDAKEWSGGKFELAEKPAEPAKNTSTPP